MKKVFLSVMFSAVATLLLAQSGTPAGLAVGDKAPQFKAKDYTGKPVNLKKMLQQGPVVVLFYRGQWCPYCNRQLSALNDSLQLLRDKKAQVVAITPETVSNVGKTVAKTKAAFPIVSDNGMVIMNAYKVAFAVDTATIAKYKNYGIDFDQANGGNGASLPVPAVYIISSKGIITYRYFEPNYAKRPLVKDLLEHL